MNSPSKLVFKNAAAAPMIFFDNAPLVGQMNGIVEIELSARASIPLDAKNVGTEYICVGHLRCSIEAAVALRRAIDVAFKMAKFIPPDEEEIKTGEILRDTVNRLARTQ